MAMTAWSTTAANNVLANTGINMDEGMAPSALNDSIREIMAVLKTAIDTGNMTATGTTFNLVNATATTVNFAGAATTVTMGAGAASTLNANFTTAINLNTAAIVSNQTTVAVINTNATTVNAFGAASVALNIGHASAAAAFPGGISIPTGKNVTGTGTAQVTGFATVSATTGTFTNIGGFALTGGITSATNQAINIGTGALTAGAGTFSSPVTITNASSPYINFIKAASTNTIIGVVNNNNDLFTNSTAGDLAIRGEAGKSILLGLDDGSGASDVVIGPTGTVKILNLAGTGTRTVVVDANGVLSAP